MAPWTCLKKNTNYSENSQPYSGSIISGLMLFLTSLLQLLSSKLVKAAKAAGFKIKIHADEFSPLGGAKLAAEEEATSADHLINITEEGIQSAFDFSSFILIRADPIILYSFLTASSAYTYH